MNLPAVIASPDSVRMSSLQLVEFINHQRGEGEADLRHADFLAKVPKVLGQDERNFSSVYLGGNGQERPCYNFPKREACLMAMSYSYELQAKVFDHMTELEAQVAQPTRKPLIELTELEIVTRNVNAIADFLRVNGTSRASMLQTMLKTEAPSYLPLLPAYATNAPRTSDGKILGGEGSSMAAYAATGLLKKFKSTWSIHKFNAAAEAAGYLEVLERPSTQHNNVVRCFKAVSAKGLEFGYNLSHENSKGDVQPVWFLNKFEQLLENLK